LTTILTAVVGLVWVQVRIGPPKLALHRVKGEFAEGFYYCASMSATTIYNDIDKTMLVRMSSLDAAGIYAAAYRLIDLVFIPVRSLLTAALPGYFRAGCEGLAGTVRHMMRIMPKAVGYAAFSVVAVVVCAPVVPHVLGAEYTRTVEALRWLALLPPLRAIHYFLADSLTGAGYQGLRTSIQASVAAFNILLNVWLIPLYSWRGAVASSLASDALLAALLLPTLVFMKGREAAYVKCAVPETHI
jgi:O-antigen/teichoic acid export membrane protein